MSKPKAAISWSGGKDSCLAFHRAQDEFDFQASVTVFAEDGQRSRSHGLRPEVVQAQADALGVEFLTGRASWESYEGEFRRLLTGLSERGFTHVVFGDIYLEAAKVWAERLCAETNLTAVEPLWGEPTPALLREFLEIGGEARIVSCRADTMDESWLGRALSVSLLAELETAGVDPCGENGEFHTVVTNAPAFRSALHLREGERVQRSGYWALDLLL